MLSEWSAEASRSVLYWSVFFLTRASLVPNCLFKLPFVAILCRERMDKKQSLNPALSEVETESRLSKPDFQAPVEQGSNPSLSAICRSSCNNVLKWSGASPLTRDSGSSFALNRRLNDKLPTAISCATREVARDIPVPARFSFRRPPAGPVRRGIRRRRGARFRADRKAGAAHPRAMPGRAGAGSRRRN